MTAVLTLSAHQLPVIESVGSDVALTGVMSLGLLHIVGADQSVSGQSRFLRDNNIAEGDKEERGFYEVVQKLMAKNLVSKMVKSESVSALDKVDDTARLSKISTASDDHLASVFKFSAAAKMSPDDLAIELKAIQGADDDIIEKAVGWYTMYLKGDWP
ncbi:Secreted RxLR effector peptide protein [Phytophthora palmivora]|uniref:Secreted RxLR effector peptide protein n=1 Tax=Phytophthora palmivora TaxID=4796 RepID=A0A2P4YJD5_9STRA|nr:Secreted RxLR effector peptide protein [Phytophthora palmivora]